MFTINYSNFSGPQRRCLMGLKTLDQMIDNLGGHLVRSIFVFKFRPDTNFWTLATKSPVRNEIVAKHLLFTAWRLLHSRHGLKASSINNQEGARELYWLVQVMIVKEFTLNLTQALYIFLRKWKYNSILIASKVKNWSSYFCYDY